MAVFNKKNAMIGWAVIEAARLASGRREKAVVEEDKKPRHVRKAVAAATAAVVAVGGIAAIRRRIGAGPGPGE